MSTVWPRTNSAMSMSPGCPVQTASRTRLPRAKRRKLFGLIRRHARQRSPSPSNKCGGRRRWHRRHSGLSVQIRQRSPEADISQFVHGCVTATYTLATICQGKGKVDFYIATYRGNCRDLYNRRKWQLIGKSQWCCSANCGHPLHLLT